MRFDGWSPGGIGNWVDVDQHGTTLVQRIQDVSPFLERNKYLRDHANQWRGEDNDFWHVASVPNIVIEQWLQRGINLYRDEDWPKVQALLNGDYKWLKTAPVTV